MKHLLNEILNPKPSVDRKSKIRYQLINKQDRVSENNSHQMKNSQDNQNQSYEREEVTEEIIFANDSESIKNELQISASLNNQKSSNMHNSYSQGGLREIRQVKIINHKQKQLQFLRSEESYPQQSEVLVEQDIYQHNPKQDFVAINKKISNKILQELILRVKTAKQTQIQLLGYFQQEKFRFQQLMKILKLSFDKKAKQIVTKLKQQLLNEMHVNQEKGLENQKKMQQKQDRKSILSNEQRWQIQKKLIKEELEQRYLYRIQKLQQQLAQKRNYEKQQSQRQSLYQNLSIENQNPDSKENQNKTESEIQRLNEELEITKFQLQQKNTLIAELELENQKLNQHIFDVEQKIQGIELEVENKVRLRIKEIEQQTKTNKNQIELNPILQASSHLQQSSKMLPFQNYTPSKIQQLLSFNEALKQKLQKIQSEKNILESQLKEHQKILAFREQQIQQNEEDIKFEWAQVEKQRQSVFIREQQLAVAEQNISKKISQIRLKQTEFQKWQNQLQTRQVNLDYKDEEFNRKLEQLVQRQNMFKMQRQQLMRDKQIYKTAGNHEKSRKNILEFNSQAAVHGKNGVQKGQLPINRKNYQEYDFRQQKSFQNEYQFKNNNNDIIKNHLDRTYQDINKSYSRLNKEKQRERMAISGTNFRPKLRQSHQFVLPQNNSRIHNRSRSKRKSNQKILLRNNYNPSPSGNKNLPFKAHNRLNQQIHPNRSQSNLDGLGSKLQRLRDEIKRQIDSIK